MDVFLQKMGMRIAARRKELGLTQDDLADAVDLSPQTISTAECGRKALRPENIAKISIALNCSTDYLLMGSESQIPYTKITKIHDNLTPLQHRCLNQIIENYLIALSSNEQ